MRPNIRVGVAGLLLCIAASGCGNDSISRNGMERTGMDMQGAADRSDEILDEVLSEIQPDVQWAHDPTTTGTCDVTRRRTVMTIISDGRRGSFLGLVDRYWKKSGYRIKSINKDVDVPAIYAQTEDGFGVSLIFGDKGQAFFQVDSPCVDESAVAESATRPNGLPYEGVYPLPRPNVRSDFWSASAP